MLAGGINLFGVPVRHSRRRFKFEKDTLVIKAIETYAEDAADQDFPHLMEKYKTELAETRTAFSGTHGLNTVNDYVQIDDASV